MWQNIYVLCAQVDCQIHLKDEEFAGFGVDLHIFSGFGYFDVVPI